MKFKDRGMDGLQAEPLCLLPLEEDPQVSNKITVLDHTLISVWWDLEQTAQLTQTQAPPPMR